MIFEIAGSRERSQARKSWKAGGDFRLQKSWEAEGDFRLGFAGRPEGTSDFVGPSGVGLMRAGVLAVNLTSRPLVNGVPR